MLDRRAHASMALNIRWEYTETIDQFDANVLIGCLTLNLPHHPSQLNLYRTIQADLKNIEDEMIVICQISSTACMRI